MSAAVAMRLQTLGCAHMQHFVCIRIAAGSIFMKGTTVNHATCFHNNGPLMSAYQSLGRIHRYYTICNYNNGLLSLLQKTMWSTSFCFLNCHSNHFPQKKQTRMQHLVATPFFPHLK